MLRIATGTLHGTEADPSSTSSAAFSSAPPPVGCARHSLHLLLWRWYGQSVPPPRTSERFFIFFAVPEFSKPSFGLHPKNCVQEQ